MSKPVKIFISYSHKDAEARDELIARLAGLKSDGLISVWLDNEIAPGDTWRDAIFSHLAESDILLYLTSAASLASANCNRELASALNANMRVIPIIVEECDWLHHPLSDFKALPDKGKPIRAWKPESRGWQNVVERLRGTVTAMQSQANSPSEMDKKELSAESAIQRGNVLMTLGQLDTAVEAYSNAINLNPRYAEAYYHRGMAYAKTGTSLPAIEDWTMAIKLKPKFSLAYYHRGETWLSLREWDKARTDLAAAKSLGTDITAAFHNTYKSISMFEKRNGLKLPKDIVAMLMQYPVNIFNTTQRVLTASGKPWESFKVLELLAKFRNAGKPLSEYLHTRSSRGITTGLNEAFIVDAAARDALIAEHRSSADILKPILDRDRIRRWRVKLQKQDKWLIFTPRGTELNKYPAIENYLRKYKDTLSKRAGSQEWYELQTVPKDAAYFEQPKCLYSDQASATAFAFDDEGHYFGSTTYVLPSTEPWLLGVLNTSAVSWFCARTTPQPQKTPFLKFSPRAIAQIPIPDMNSAQKALIHKLVEYILYLKKQPTTDGSDLANARDYVMVEYFSNIVGCLVYELYLPNELHQGDKHFFQPLFEERLPVLEEMPGDDKVPAFREIFEHLSDRHHPIRRNRFFLDSLQSIRIIESKKL